MEGYYNQLDKYRNPISHKVIFVMILLMEVMEFLLITISFAYAVRYSTKFHTVYDLSQDIPEKFNELEYNMNKEFNYINRILFNLTNQSI